MTLAEMFLLAWAVVATILAVALHTHCKKVRLALILMQVGVRMVGEGRAKIVIDGDNIKLMEV